MQLNGPQAINQGTPPLSLNGFSRRIVMMPRITPRGYERRDVTLDDANNSINLTVTPQASTNNVALAPAPAQSEPLNMAEATVTSGAIEITNNPVPTNVSSQPVSQPADKPSYEVVAIPDPVKPVETVFLTGSQMQQEKKKLPIGIYAIAGFSLVGLVANFFDSSQTGFLYTLAMILDILLIAGLVFRIEQARKILLWLSGLTVVMVIITSLMLVGLRQKIKQNQAKYESAMNSINQKTLTMPQKQELNILRLAVVDDEKLAGKAITFTYIKNGVTALGAVAVMVYLMRPNVKNAFKTDK